MVRLVLLRILESYFRHRWLYLLPIVITSIAAVVFVFTAPSEYTSYGTIYVRGESMVASLNNLPREGGMWWMTPAQLTTSQIGELLQTEAFVRSAIQQTPLEPMMANPATAADAMEQFRTSVWTETIGDNLVRFGADHKDPQMAQQLASKLMESYVLWKLNSDQKNSGAAEAFFTDLIKPYQEQLDHAQEELHAYLESNPEPIRGARPEAEQIVITRLQAEMNMAADRVNSIQEKAETARLAQIQAESDMRQSYLLIDAVYLPTKPGKSLRALALDNIVFVGVGFILLVVGVLGGALIDRSLRFPIDVQHLLSLPTLVVIPDEQTCYRPPAAANRNRSETSEPVDPVPVAQQALPNMLAQQSHD